MDAFQSRHQRNQQCSGGWIYYKTIFITHYEIFIFDPYSYVVYGIIYKDVSIYPGSVIHGKSIWATISKFLAHMGTKQGGNHLTRYWTSGSTIFRFEMDNKNFFAHISEMNIAIETWDLTHGLVSKGKIYLILCTR